MLGFAAALVAALALGLVVGWLARERETAALREATTQERARNAELVVQLAQAQGDGAQARADLASERATLTSERAAFARERANVDAALLGQFQEIAQSALTRASATLTELASARLSEERQAVAGVIAPVEAEFKRFAEAVAGMQKSSAEDGGAMRASLAQISALQTSLSEAVQATNASTGRLSHALQNPHTAGAWGELALDRIVELAGMTEHCDFDRQKGLRSEDGSRERPDMTIHLTGDLDIPVDAKTTMTNYLKAIDAPDDAERGRLLKQSASDLRTRVNELRGRAYDRIPGYAGMTLMFVPNESMLASALHQDRDLLEDATRSRIVICSPLLLFCYLQAFANGWRIQKQQANATEVARRGRMLFDRLKKFLLAINAVGSALERTVEKYNEVVKKSDNLLVPGRELGRLLGSNDQLVAADVVGSSVRKLEARTEDASTPDDSSGAVPIDDEPAPGSGPGLLVV